MWTHDVYLAGSGAGADTAYQAAVIPPNGSQLPQDSRLSMSYR